MTHFKTTNMARFTWKRQALGGILIRSIPTTLEYYLSLDGGGWKRSTWRRRSRETARRVMRYNED
jgi:hypothetical protein